MSGFFSKRNTLELNRMFQFISRKTGAPTEEHEFEVRFGKYATGPTRRFIGGLTEVGVAALKKADLFSSGPVKETTLIMIATGMFDHPRKIITFAPKTGKVMKTEYQKKVNMNNVYSTGNNIKISLNKEISVKHPGLEPRYDLFRFRERESYVSKNKMWRYDFTKVYQLSKARNPAIFKEWLSNVTGGKIRYTSIEFELEYLPNKTQKNTGEFIRQSFLEELIKINNVIKFSKVLFSNTDKADVFTALQVLIPNRLRGKQISDISVKGGIAKSLGTVNYANLALLLGGKYAATEKIDGHRTLVFILNCEVYFILLSNEVIKLQTPPETAGKLKKVNNTLFDAEYVVTKNKKHSMVAVFDLLVDKSENLTLVQNLKERHERARKHKDILDLLSGTKFGLSINRDGLDSNQHKFFLKKFYYPDSAQSFHNAVQSVCSTKFPYKLDGLIFSPIADTYYSGTSLKWKPSQEQTIDFLVRIYDHDSKKKSIRIGLYVGVSIRDFISKRMKRPDGYFDMFPQYTERSYYFPILFQPQDSPDVGIATLSYSDHTDGVYTVNGVPVQDNTVIEMARIGDKWVPIKYRGDKTGVYQSQGRDAGNYWHIAHNVWENILNPITLKILTGKEEVTDKYFRKVASTSSLMGMVRFHNYIKLCYYKRYSGKGNNTWAMELGSGRGNDINKHIRVNLRNVLLVEVDPAASAEGQARIDALDPRERTTNFQSLVLDASTDVTKDLTKAGYKPGQFDLIVCNFAIHYLFSSQQAIRTIRDYINKFLKRGGTFMFSTFDGKKVFDFLRENGVQYNQEYKFFDKDQLLFVIKRLFKADDFAHTGQQIAVYIDRIGMYQTEYLMNLDFITKEFTSGGFKLLENSPFRKWYPTFSKKMRNRPQTKMSDAECQFSFFNHYVVFQKN